jgi:amino-acid N-acetyltransferase
LSSAATKRDAKAYITRLKTTPSEQEKRVSHLATFSSLEPPIARPEVNLGTFFGHAIAVEQSPRFSQYGKSDNISAIDEQNVHHLALVKLVGLEDLDDAVLQGIGLTLSQLCRLSMTPCVVLDFESLTKEDSYSQWRQRVTYQAERLENATRGSSGGTARIMDNIYSLSDTAGLPKVFSTKVLMSPIKSGQIPIILPLAYSDKTQTVTPISSHQAILALTREFGGVNVCALPGEDVMTTVQRVKVLQKQTSLDRLIILDPLGGIPHPARPGSNHVFLNMEQEYHDVRKELLEHTETKAPPSPTQPYPSEQATFSPSMSGLQPMCLPGKREQVAQAVFTSGWIPPQKAENQKPLPNLERHVENLDLLRDVLAYLPASSSAIVTTPLDAARSSKTSPRTTAVSAVGTRTQKNPLIHNLLTDKPAYSASLPMGRLGRSNDAGNIGSNAGSATFVKRGMPLTMIPDPRIRPWTPDNHGKPNLKLTDASIDLSRLIYLIDDSFNRKLDAEHYLSRVNDRIAGLIISGEYEGGALFTWETPPGAPPGDLSRSVPYLDKFAVLQRSQGAGGVADIVFNAMVRGCFPNGVCWRSRRDNPVNKWYFERARGTWKIPDTNWTMFWTTEGVEVGDGGRFKDYEAVCRGVEPSWADKKRVAD